MRGLGLRAADGRLVRRRHVGVVLAGRRRRGGGRGRPQRLAVGLPRVYHDQITRRRATMLGAMLLRLRCRGIDNRSTLL